MSLRPHDALEVRDPMERETALLAALPAHVQAAQAVPAMAERLAGVQPNSVNSRAALAQLPVTRKHELFEQQKSRHAGSVFGGFSALGWNTQRALRPAKRVYQSPGPIYEPEGHAADYWRTEIVRADPRVWAWFGRRVPERVCIAIYRATFFYGLTRMIAWTSYAHVLNDYAWDLSWGGPYWMPQVQLSDQHPAVVLGTALLMATLVYLLVDGIIRRTDPTPAASATVDSGTG